MIYKRTQSNSFSKDFGLKTQIRRASVSVVSNIAEGEERGSNKESARFFHISKGSIAEIRTQLNIAYKIGYIDLQTSERLEDKADKISASLWKLIVIRKTIS